MYKLRYEAFNMGGRSVILMARAQGCGWGRRQLLRGHILHVIVLCASSWGVLLNFRILQGGCYVSNLLPAFMVLVGPSRLSVVGDT